MPSLKVPMTINLRRRGHFRRNHRVETQRASNQRKHQGMFRQSWESFFVFAPALAGRRRRAVLRFVLDARRAPDRKEIGWALKGSMGRETRGLKTAQLAHGLSMPLLRPNNLGDADFDNLASEFQTR